MGRRGWVLGAALAAVALAALGVAVLRGPSDRGGAPAAGRVSSAIGDGNLTPVALVGAGRFDRPGRGSAAVSYDPGLVPPGAWGAVSLAGDRPATRVVLRLGGLVPGHRYRALAHTHRCGPAAADAGPAFRPLRDGVPGVPNEIGLPTGTGGWFAPDRTGIALVAADVPSLTPGRLPGSVVLHAGPVSADTPGPAVGCLSLDG